MRESRRAASGQRQRSRYASELEWRAEPELPERNWFAMPEHPEQDRGSKPELPSSATVTTFVLQP